MPKFLDAARLDLGFPHLLSQAGCRRTTHACHAPVLRAWLQSKASSLPLHSQLAHDPATIFQVYWTSLVRKNFICWIAIVLTCMPCIRDMTDLLNSSESKGIICNAYGKEA